MPARAQSATWLPTPSSGNWNTAANWSPAVPTASGTATFGDSSIKALTISQNTAVGTMLLNTAGYSFSIPDSLTLTAGNISGTGGFTLNGGVLEISHVRLGGGPVDYLTATGNIVNNGILRANIAGASVQTILTGDISGSGSLLKTGTFVAPSAGALILQGTNTLTGGTVVSSGLLQIGGTGVVAAQPTSTGSLEGAVQVDAEGELRFLRDSLTFGGSISGSGTVSVNGATVAVGTVTLTGNNSAFNGRLLINPRGTLSVGSRANLGAGVIGGNSGTLRFTSSFDEPVPNTFSITGAGGVNFDTQANTNTLSGPISGDGAFKKDGSGTLILTNNKAVGSAAGRAAITITSGTLQVGDGGTVGSIETSNGTNTVANSGTLAFNRSDTYMFGSPISGTGSVDQRGGGTLILTGAHTYGGGTRIGAGTLQVAADNNLGASTGALALDGGTLRTTTGFATGRALTLEDGGGTFAPADGSTLTVNGAIGGDGALHKIGASTLILTGNNAYSGGTKIGAGTLQLGSGGTTGSLGTGGVVNDAALVLNRSGALTYGGAASGGGTVTKIGAGVLTLDGTQNSTGLTTVAAGTLRIAGTVGGAVEVDSGATLGGGGKIDGSVTVAAGARLSPGASPGTLRVGTLALNDTSQLDYELGLPNVFGGGVNDLTVVAGDLTLDGKLNIFDFGGFGAREAVSPGAFGPGVYRLFEYGGQLVDNGLDLSVLPGSFTPSQLLLQTAVAGQVNLIVVSGGFTMQFWDGANQTAGIDGGTAAWNATATSWANSDGSVNAPWQSGFAVFQGAAGTVTLGEPVAFTGMQFATDGYRIDGAGFDLQAAAVNAPINVSTGTATLDATIVDGAAPSRLSKTGGGTLVLGRANTYSGGTTISGGALQAATDQNLGASAGNVLLNDGALITTGSFESARTVTLASDGGTFAPAAGTTLTLNGAIGGSGELRKSGAGTVVLNSVNDFSGGTRLGAGILQAAGDPALGASSGALAFDGGTLRFGAAFDPAVTRAVTLGAAGGSVDTNGFTSTFAQSVDGAGALTKLGAGTLILAADNSYAGGTTVSAGTLQVGNGAAAGNVAGDIANDGALIFDRSDELAYDGTISGSGSITQAGGGTLILSNDQRYTGATTVAAGTLQLGSGGASGSVAGSVTNNGALVFNRRDSFTYGGVVAGTGTMTQGGTGTLVLTQNQTYSGGTTIRSGTLQLGNGGTTGNVAGDVVNDGTLVFDRSDDVAFAGAIHGTGNVVKNGANTLTLTGTSTYTGVTQLDAGRLFVNGTIASPVAVGTNAVLGGTGIIGGAHNAGRVAPGASIGTLSVAGDFVQDATGTLEIELNDRGNVDLLAVSGAAAIAGRVDYVIDPASTFAENLVLTYLTAGAGVTGTFENADQELAGVRFTTVYRPDAVQLVVTTKPLIEPATGGGAGEGAQACAESLEQRRRGASGDALTTLSAITRLPVDELAAAIGNVCVRDPTALPAVMQAQATTRLTAVGRRVAQIQGEATGAAAPFVDAYRLRDGIALWVQETYQDGRTEARDALRRGYDDTDTTFVLGVDAAQGDAGVLGGYLAYDHADVDYHGVSSDNQALESDGWSLGVYGSLWSARRWYLQGSAEYGWKDIDSTRAIQFASIAREAHGERDGNNLLVSTGFGYAFQPSSRWLLQPEILASYSRWDEDGYAETGADSLDLTYGDFTAETSRVEAGLTAHVNIGPADRGLAVLTPYVRYVADHALDDRELGAQFPSSAPFAVSEDVPTQHGVRYGLGFSQTWRDNAAFYANIDVQDIAERTSSNATFGVLWRF